MTFSIVALFFTFILKGSQLNDTWLQHKLSLCWVYLCWMSYVLIVVMLSVLAPFKLVLPVENLNLNEKIDPCTCVFQINMGSVYRGQQQLTDEEVLAIYKRRHLTSDMLQSTVSWSRKTHWRERVATVDLLVLNSLDQLLLYPKYYLPLLQHMLR